MNILYHVSLMTAPETLLPSQERPTLRLYVKLIKVASIYIISRALKYKLVLSTSGSIAQLTPPIESARFAIESTLC